MMRFETSTAAGVVWATSIAATLLSVWLAVLAGAESGTVPLIIGAAAGIAVSGAV